MVRAAALQPLLPPWETLDLAQQVAQMVVVRASGFLFDHQIQYPAWEPPAATLRHWVQDWGVGGVILLGGSAAELGLRSQQLQDWASIPLLLAADVEEGVGQRFSGATWFPPPMALGDWWQRDPEAACRYAARMGAITAQESLAIGLNWVLAPIVDVNNNPHNPVINVRAFGDNPEMVQSLTTAFIQGAKEAAVLTTAKHFPGHGDTQIDSHLTLPSLPHSPERLAAIELPPFQAAIAAGVDTIMSAHLQIPAWDAVYPATLSPRILTQELRQNLGFEGLIVTDALIMGAIAQSYGPNEAPVLALEAGADILLMPADPVGAIQAVCEAVNSGRIAPERIHASLERIWQAKRKTSPDFGDTDASTHDWETLPPPPIQLQALAQPAAQETVETILHQSMRVHCPQPLSFSAPDNPGQEPLARRNLVMVDDLLKCDFLSPQSPAIAQPTQWGYTLHLCDRHQPFLDPSLFPSQPTLLQLFIRGNPFRGSAGLTHTAERWLRSLLDTQQLQALIVYGSPYALEQFLPLLPPDLPYLFTYGQMPAAQAIALATLFPPSKDNRSSHEFI